MQPDEPTREELQEIIAQLRQELEALRDELRRIRQDRYEVPPHY